MVGLCEESTELEVDAGSVEDGEAAQVRSLDEVQRELEYARLLAQVSAAAVVLEVLR